MNRPITHALQGTFSTIYHHVKHNTSEWYGRFVTLIRNNPNTATTAFTFLTAAIIIIAGRSIYKGTQEKREKLKVEAKAFLDSAISLKNTKTSHLTFIQQAAERAEILKKNKSLGIDEQDIDDMIVSINQAKALVLPKLKELDQVNLEEVNPEEAINLNLSTLITPETHKEVEDLGELVDSIKAKEAKIELDKETAKKLQEQNKLDRRNPIAKKTAYYFNKVTPYWTALKNKVFNFKNGA